MAERVLQLYEAMFLVEPGIATDWEAAQGMVQKIMDRAKAQLLVCRLWDERRLAYPIKKQRRAAYILCYFKADGTTIGGIERDTQLSEHLLRVLVLRADHVTDEELEKITATPDRRIPPAAAAAARPPASAPPAGEPLPKTEETVSSDSDQANQEKVEDQSSDQVESDKTDEQSSDQSDSDSSDGNDVSDKDDDNKPSD